MYSTKSGFFMIENELISILLINQSQQHDEKAHNMHITLIGI